MARKKAGAAGLGSTQQGLQEIVEGKIQAMETAIADLAESRLIAFTLGGGLDAEILNRMQPHFQEFERQTAECIKPAAASTKHLAMIGSGDDDENTIEVGASDA